MLVIHPKVFFPTGNFSQPLTNKEYVNSGLLLPGASTPASFHMKIGSLSSRGGQKLPYECILHEGNGMTATLVVTPR